MSWVVRSYALAFTWYVPLAVGELLCLTHPAPETQAEAARG